MVEKSTATAGDTSVVYKESFKIGRRTKFDVSAGIGYTFNDGFNNNVISDDNKPTDIENVNEQVHGILGLHWYPFCGGLYKQSDKFIGFEKHPLSRVSLFAGIDIIRPRYNYYPGIGVDLIPGLKLIGGVQLYRSIRYDVFNDKVIDKKAGLENAGFFMSLHIDSKVFTRIFNPAKS